MSVFEKFETGQLFLGGNTLDMGSIVWSPHPKFEGVALKHLLTAKDTGGAFSYHLVRILPQKIIGVHRHETQLETHEVIGGFGWCQTCNSTLAYKVGNMAVLPAGVEHEVAAGDEGLLLFAKFIPALC